MRSYNGGWIRPAPNRPIVELIRNLTVDSILTPETIIAIPLVTALCGAFIGSTLSEKWHHNRIKTHKDNFDKEKAALQTVLNSETERRIISETKCTLLKRERDDLKSSQRLWEIETGTFLKSLSVPHTLGKWGELSLRRTVERAGLVNMNDFVEQETVSDKEGKSYRLDMVIRLHGNRSVIIDSKISLSKYEEALKCTDEIERRAKLKLYAAVIKGHITGLSNKAYWSLITPHPDFVIAFLPGEAFYSAALHEDPGLVDYCFEKKVILASPSTLFCLLKVIECGWRNEKANKNYNEIHCLLNDLHERTLKVSKDFNDVGKNFEKSLKSYNNAVTSLHSRLLVTTRNIKALGGVIGDDIPVISHIDINVKDYSSSSLFKLSEVELELESGSGSGSGSGSSKFKEKRNDP